MTITPISFGTGSDQSRFAVGGAARFINCYLENQGSNSKTPAIVVASDGLINFATLPTFGVRAMLQVNGVLYAVAGNTLYSVTTVGVVTSLGTINATGTVYMQQNRRLSPQIGIVVAGNYYVYDTGTGAFTSPTVSGATDFQPYSLSMLDGYGVLPVGNAKWYITNVDDFTTINPLNFATAEAVPDVIVTTAAREGEIVLFGAAHIEWWADTAAAVNNPFSRSQSINLGCLAAGSVAQLDRSLAWIAHDGTVRLMDGYAGDVISTHAVERAIESVDPSIISSTSWWNNGHTFYCITCASWTWVYDLKTQRWHERQSGTNNYWTCAVVTRLGNNLVAGDVASGNLYYMNSAADDEAGTELVLTVQTPPVHAFPARLRFNSLFVDIIPGVGLPTGATQDVAPNIMLQWSDNGGQTWSIERTMPLGVQGTSTLRAVVRRLGATTPIGRTFKLSISAAVAKGLMGLSVDSDQLAA